MNDEPSYRTPFNFSPAQSASLVSADDENNYSTLKALYLQFTEASTALYTDFNAFDVLTEGTTQAKRDKMMRQIAGNQIAYDILSPLVESLETVIRDIENKWKV